MSADIHALEIEFAKSPTLDACLPLCEAYLGAKRYMEAMVVCKKGIKSGAPTDARGRVMLARIYLEQGKFPKAEQEVGGVLAEFPGNPHGLELQGRIFIDMGKRPEAAAALQAALQADPTLTRARAWLAELGVAAGAPSAAAPVAAPTAVAPAARPAAVTPAPRTAAVPIPVLPPAATPAASAPPAAAPPPTATPAHAAPEAHDVPAAPARSMAHVGDFFAPDALGYSNDASNIETAGPGRLTILGFVPKNSGSLKITLGVVLVGLACLAAYLTWTVVSAKNTKVISALFKEVRAAFDQDRYAGYKEAIAKGEKVLQVDRAHVLTLSVMAYAEAVLATDHRDNAALPKAQDLLTRATQAMSAKDENEFRIAAKALLACADKQYDKGLTELKEVMDKGASSPLIELEAFRLMNAVKPLETLKPAEVKPGENNTQVQMARLVRSVSSSSQARALNYLGWFYYEAEDWGKAGKYFDQTLQNVKDHPMALLGRALVTLDQGVGLEQKQKDVEKDLKLVFALPADEMSPPVTALAYFARAQLLRWQGSVAKADSDFAEAVKLDPINALFPYRRGVALLKLGAAKEAVEELKRVAGMEQNNAKYLKRLAEAQTKAGLFSEAKASLERAASLLPADHEIGLLQGALALQQHDYAGALKAYSAVTREDGGVNFTHAQLGINTALRETDKVKAVKHMEDFLGKLPESAGPEVQARVWCELGLDHEALKNKAKATAAYTNGIEAFRYYPDCHFYLCRLLGKGAEAKEACATYLTLDPRGKHVAEAQKHTK